MDLGLTGKRAIVTGGTRGIGLAIAATLIAEGARVAVCARGAEGVEAALSTLGNNASGAAVDVAEPASYASWINSTIDEFGGLDIFIGNVALTPPGDAEERWKTAFEVDLMHCVRGCSAAMHALVDSGSGSIVLVSSVSSVMAQVSVEEQAYGAMKAALATYASQLAQDLGSDGVRVNCVSPGPILFDGGAWDEIRASDPELFDYATGLPALGRLGTPEEVANTVVFLASDASSFTTGSNVRIDGGTLKHAQPA